MDRRGFMKGLLAAPVAGALIVRPSHGSEIELFQPKIEEPVLISRPFGNDGYTREGSPVFDCDGRILGFVTAFEVRSHVGELTTMHLDLIVSGHVNIPWSGPKFR